MKSKQIRIAITGPESSGKSSLAEALGQLFNCPVVPEYARGFLEASQGHYSFEDIDHMLCGQLEQEDMLASNTPLLICDTDALVCHIWQAFKYGKVSDYTTRMFEQRHYDLFVLCNIDVAWESDPLRENPDPLDRLQLFQLYQSALANQHKNYVVARGDLSQRIEQLSPLILQLMDGLLPKSNG